MKEIFHNLLGRKESVDIIVMPTQAAKRISLSKYFISSLKIYCYTAKHTTNLDTCSSTEHVNSLHEKTFTFKFTFILSS